MSRVKEQLRLALAALCAREGGHDLVADATGLSAGNLQQIISGTKLKSGRPRGIGPKTLQVLEDRFPGWENLAPQGGGEQRSMSLETVTVVPYITWDELMTVKLPTTFKVTLSDNSMAPRTPAGTTVEFTCGISPIAGDGILCKDVYGNHYFREYRQRRPGLWEAHALNDAYKPLGPVSDGITIVAVLTGMTMRWSQ
jgi:hypothetical protein